MHHVCLTPAVSLSALRVGLCRTVLVSLLLNEKNANKSDKDTKLDVLNILANVSGGIPPLLLPSMLCLKPSVYVHPSLYHVPCLRFPLAAAAADRVLGSASL